MDKLTHETLIHSIEERDKVLNCLYTIEEILADSNSLMLDEIYFNLVNAVPKGFQFPAVCHARIVVGDRQYQTENFAESPLSLSSPIKAQSDILGEITVSYSSEVVPGGRDPFMSDERRLVKTIADRLGHFELHTKLKRVFSELQEENKKISDDTKPEWSIILDIIKKTDQNLFSIISRKMLNNLFCKGLEESKVLFQKLGTSIDMQSTATELNRPSKKQVLENSFFLGLEIFNVSSKYFTDVDLLSLIQKWIHEEKSHFLVKALANLNTPLPEIADAIRRYHHINPIVYQEFASPTYQGIRVALIRRFLTDQLEYIDIAKNYCSVSDFYDILQNMIFPPESHGKLGGKSAGLFLAKKIIESIDDPQGLLKNVKTPKTWYITSDGLMGFVYYNNLEDIIEQKYKIIDEIRQEYPHIIQAFKNSHFPNEIMNGLSRALDDFGENPIIVRSSSLLEDRLGSAFAGKYKSLFLANQGPKKERLEALMDAIAEVYASTFGPDPIGYRTERQLLDFNEEMGIMIQEVVGKKVGNYFLPAFAGVAFSNNEFRWSPRINRDDGLLRLVPGLGTRAVDRVSDDYPILIAPGQPDLRVNLTYQDITAYSPKYIDVINIETNTFETVKIDDLIKIVGNNYPMLNEVFSIIEEKHIKSPVGLGIDAEKHDIIVTFENMISKTKYVKQLHYLLQQLSEKLLTPIDLEFACDGTALYLLQCRPQSSAGEGISAVIPTNIPDDKIIFTANKYVSNGKVNDITYIVYVDPEEYSKQEHLRDLQDIGKAVSQLNKLLPKKTFIMMGPGRWGSRDDIRLGVKATYSDLNNTAVLIEIARKKGNYTPDLSFGTHFFQDLVESSIRYLPLYPDDENVRFNYDFFYNAENVLYRFCPEFTHLSNTVKVINVRETTDGLVLRLLMNADEEQAVAMLADPMVVTDRFTDNNENETVNQNEKLNDEPLQWRKRMIDSILEHLDANRFGIKEIYLYGTVLDGTAGPKSDIDFVVIFDGTPEQKHDLTLWLEGWNLALGKINYNKTGFNISKFLDVSIFTEQELAENQYFADLIQKSNNTAKQLKLMQSDIM